MRHITSRHLVRNYDRLARYNFKKLNKVVQMYFADCFSNILNGYPSHMPHSFTITANLHKNDKFIPHAKSTFFKKGIIEEPVNEHFPNHTLKVRLTGRKSEIYGFKFEAKKLAIECSKRCFKGFKYSMI